jgi:alkaline phosphatase D
MIVRLALLLSLLLFTSRVQADDAPLKRIAFGSCCRQDKPQPIWDTIADSKPSLFLFIGDNIYGDSDDINVLRTKWNMLLAQPGFQKLKQTCPVWATWDDHDYGRNDGGAEFPIKRESQQLFLDVFNEPQDSPRRRQAGVYDAKIVGPVGQRVQIILLDTRYNRSPLKLGPKVADVTEGIRGIYAPDSSADKTLLGETQWKWLAEQLAKPAEVRIIASSIQVIPDDHLWEKWGNFPLERERLFKLIASSGAKGVVLLSGDRHLAEISRIDRADIGYSLFDVTSSSLNMASGNQTAGVRWVNEVNRHRIGLTWFETNFGRIDIDWTATDPALTLQVCAENGSPVLTQRVRLSELAAKTKP